LLALLVVVGMIGLLNVIIIIIMNPPSVGWTVGSSHPPPESEAAELQVHHPPIHHYNENP